MLNIISDGQLSGTGYYGTEAEVDLRGIKKEYTAKGNSSVCCSYWYTILNDTDKLLKVMRPLVTSAELFLISVNAKKFLQKGRKDDSHY